MKRFFKIIGISGSNALNEVEICTNDKAVSEVKAVSPSESIAINVKHSNSVLPAGPIGVQGMNNVVKFLSMEEATISVDKNRLIVKSKDTCFKSLLKDPGYITNSLPEDVYDKIKSTTEQQLCVKVEVDKLMKRKAFLDVTKSSSCKAVITKEGLSLTIGDVNTDVVEDVVPYVFETKVDKGLIGTEIHFDKDFFDVISSLEGFFSVDLYLKKGSNIRITAGTDDTMYEAIVTQKVQEE